MESRGCRPGFCIFSHRHNPAIPPGCQHVVVCFHPERIYSVGRKITMISSPFIDSLVTALPKKTFCVSVAALVGAKNGQDGGRRRLLEPPRHAVHGGWG